MTFAMGRRFVIADGVERWKEAEVEGVAQALAAPTRRPSRSRSSPARRAATRRPPGSTRRWRRPAARSRRKSTSRPGTCRSGSPSRPGRWTCNSTATAPRHWSRQVGERQQRLLRELEKLALEHGPGANIGAEEVEESCATSAERKVWTLADALVAGDRRTSLHLLLELRQQGERVTGLIYNMVRRLRDAVAIAEALQQGQSPAQLKKTPPDAPARRGQVPQGRAGP